MNRRRTTSSRSQNRFQEVKKLHSKGIGVKEIASTEIYRSDINKPTICVKFGNKSHSVLILGLLFIGMQGYEIVFNSILEFFYFKIQLDDLKWPCWRGFQSFPIVPPKGTQPMSLLLFYNFKLGSSVSLMFSYWTSNAVRTFVGELTFAITLGRDAVFTNASVNNVLYSRVGPTLW